MATFARPSLARTVLGTTKVPGYPRFLRTSVCAMAEKLDKSTPESTWAKILSAQDYQVLREKGTERAGTGKLNKFYEEGLYKCKGCGQPLYASAMKFDSGCGWPAFDRELPGAVERTEDNSYGMRRVEITCSNCGGHLGHVFTGEGFTETNTRHCVNSVSVTFEGKDGKVVQG